MAKRPKPVSADTEAENGKGAPSTKLPGAKLPKDLTKVHSTAMKRYEAAWRRDQDNIDQAYSDQAFRAGDQWDEASLQARRADQRPALTFNRLPQFVKQITGDIRQMRPAIRVVGVDDRADKKTAEVLAGLIRYIEARSDADSVYFSAADSQVSCGIGHWRVKTEYAHDSTFEQEIGIELIEDGVSVLWDPDSNHPTRKDAKFCFVPVDLTREDFEEKYPDKAASSITTPSNLAPPGWFTDDTVRIAEYWVKEPIKRRLGLFPGNSAVDDLTDDPDADAKAAEIEAMGGKVEMRDGYRIMRYVIDASEVLEGPTKWVGRYIPIVPIIGEEVRAGRMRYRHGIVRFAKDAQRSFNYFRSAQTEVMALQPKAPWIGTKAMFKANKAQWENANAKNYPYLEYTVDPQAPGAMPQRVAPPVNSQGIVEGVQFAAEDMKATIGIYDASLGARSNETSGRAIMARQREGDNASYVYVYNFSLAVKHTGRIIIDLIPHVYDTTRTIRVIGEDGKVDIVQINQPAGPELDGVVEKTLHDVTVGAYDVSVTMGPSYGTKREEAREGMTQLVQAAPNIAPFVLDLLAKAQDWPMADKISERLKSLLPPDIRMKEAQESGEEPPPMPEPQPNPEMIAAQAKAESDVLRARTDAMKAEADVEMKKIDLQIAQMKLAMEEAKALAAMQPGVDMQQMAEQVTMLTDAIQIVQDHLGEVGGGMEMPEPPEGPEMMGGPMPAEMPPQDIQFDPGAMPPDAMQGAMPPQDFPPASA